MVFVMLVSCGQGTPPAQNGKDDTTPNNSVDADKPYAGTTIRFLASNHSWADTVEPLLPEFEEKTGIKVNIEKFELNQTAEKATIELSSKNDTLDVVYIRPMSEGRMFIENGWLEPVDQYWEGDAEFDADDLMEAAKDAFTVDDVIYGAPVTTERQILYYRKDLLEEKNIPVSTTLDELYEAAVKLNNPEAGIAGIVSRGAASVTCFASYLFSFGGQYQDGTTSTLDTPEAAEAIKYYGKILKDAGPDGILNMTHAEVSALFAQGQAAMITEVDALYQSIADPASTELSDKIGYARFPAGPAGSKPINSCSFGLGISAFSKNKDAAWEFIKWSVGKEINAKIHAAGAPTARESAWADEEINTGLPAEMVEAVKDSFEGSVGVDRPLTLNYPMVRDVIIPLLGQSMMNGGENMEELIQNANKEIQAVYDSYDK